MYTIPLPWPDTSLLLSLPLAHLDAWMRYLVLGAMCLVPIVLMIVLYRYEMKLVSRLTALLLLGLRLVVMLLVLGLVSLQPVFAHDERFEIPGRVIVVVDRSASMEVSDPRREPIDALRLAQTFNLGKDIIAPEWITRWIEDLENKKPLRWVLPEELRGTGVNRKVLTAERKADFDRVMRKVGETTRTQFQQRILGESGLNLLDKIRSRHQVQVIGFDKDVREISPERLSEVFGKSSTNDLTDLTAPLDWIGEQSASSKGPILGVVYLSDGQHTAYTNGPFQAATRLGSRGVPIYCVALGDERPPPGVIISTFKGPEYTIVKDIDADLQVEVRITGQKAQEFVLDIFEEGKNEPLVSKPFTHTGEDELHRVTTEVRLKTEGTHNLTARVRPGRQEFATETPTSKPATTIVSVADEKTRVLLVDGQGRWEYHYLATALGEGRNRLVELNKILFEQPRLDDRLTAKQIKQMGLPAQEWPQGEAPLSGYGCIILGDVDTEKLTLPMRQDLEKYVADAGGTLVLVAGKRFMPRGYPDVTPLGEPDPLRRLLPIDQPRVLAPEEGFPLTLTGAGKVGRLMELDSDPADNATLWAGFPKPWGWAITGKAKPAAIPLASWLDPKETKKPISERERENAVIVRHNYGFGRVMFIGIDSTWRWRFRAGEEYHHRFWGQIIRWAAADRPLVAGNEYVRFGTPQPVYRPGEAIEVMARLTEKMGMIPKDLLAGARIIRLPEGDEKKEKDVALVPLARRDGQPRVLEGKQLSLSPGQYAIELAIPPLAERLLTPAKGTEPAKPLRANFQVTAPESREMIKLEMDLPVLQGIASATKGRVFFPTEVGELEKLLIEKSITEVTRHESQVSRWWLILLLATTLLTVEWLIRKQSGLP